MHVSLRFTFEQSALLALQMSLEGKTMAVLCNGPTVNHTPITIPLAVYNNTIKHSERNFSILDMLDK